MPVQTALGFISWDSGRFPSIGAVGESIRHHCVEAAGIPGMSGTGGMEVAGK